MKYSLQFELLNTYYSKIACKMSYTPSFPQRIAKVVAYGEKSYKSIQIFQIYPNLARPSLHKIHSHLQFFLLGNTNNELSINSDVQQFMINYMVIIC